MTAASSLVKKNSPLQSFFSHWRIQADSPLWKDKKNAGYFKVVKVLKIRQDQLVQLFSDKNDELEKLFSYYVALDYELIILIHGLTEWKIVALVANTNMVTLTWKIQFFFF